MVSIIIPVYNQADKLAKCLDSILAQTILAEGNSTALRAIRPYQNDSFVIPPPRAAGEESLKDESTASKGFLAPLRSARNDKENTPLTKRKFENLEVIIVNDGSIDNIENVIKEYKSKFENFKFISQENKGSNPARNRGFKESKGEYVIFCDADIEMAPEMLEAMLMALKNNPQAAYAYSSFRFGPKLFKLFPFDADKLKKMPYIHTTSLIRREYFPGFDENIKRLQDWDLWLAILEKGKSGIWTDKVLFKVKTGGTISSWLPSFFYKIFPFLPAVKKYKRSVKIIKAKHNL